VSETVLLRPYQPGDREFFVALFGDPEVCAHIGGPRSTKQANALFDALLGGTHERAIAAFAVVTAVELVGHCALLREPEPGDVEIGFMIARAHWGRGLGTQAARALQIEAKRRGFSRAIGTVDLENIASQRVLDKLGGERTLDRDAEGEFHRFVVPL
jgi:RimJ/RimL family protein N-acetyltransferase